MTWQPIATAPNDGSEFDVWARNYDNIHRSWSNKRIACLTSVTQVDQEWEALYWMAAPTPPAN